MLALVLAVALAVNDQPSAVNLSFSMRGDRARGWPVKTKITLTSKAAQQEWTIEAADARRPVSLKVAPGAYRMTIAAEHHRLFARELEIDKDLSLPEIALAPVPAISGRVIQRVKEIEIPLPGAQITAGSKLLTTTDERGVFRVELGEPPPEEITVVHTGQAPKTIPLFEDLSAENELGTIELPRGVSVTALLDRPSRDAKTLTVSLFDKKTIASREAKPFDDRVVFDDIAPGNYLIVAKGNEPLEFTTEAVEVKDDDVEQKVSIDPFPLDGRVILGNEPLRDGGTLDVVGPASAWHAKVPVDAEGRFGGTMWQSGKVTGWLQTPLSANGIMQTSPELGPGPSTWTIALKRRFLQGRIFDETTKEPVTRAAIELEITSGEHKTSTNIEPQKDGSYSILAMQNGRYELRVTAPEHVDATKVAFLGEDDEGRILDFPLEGGVEVLAYVSWPDSQPVAGATVLSNDGRARRTNASGRLSVRMHPGESRMFVVIPREGSFAFIDLSLSRNGAAPKPLQVVVPPPAGSLRITTLDRKRNPVRRPLLVSYNSRSIPAPVLARLMSTENADNGVVRLRRLPAGFYTIGTLATPTARATVTSGETAVELVAVR